MHKKYIIVSIANLESPILFPGWISHSEFAKAFPVENIISAGFVRFDGSEFVAFGCSESLGISGRGEVDSEIINKAFL